MHSPSALWIASACLSTVIGIQPARSADPLPQTTHTNTVASWSRFRGPDGLGVGPAKGLPVAWSPARNILWKTELPGPGASSPILFGDRICVTSYSGYAVPGSPGNDMNALRRHVVRLNRATGTVLWKKDFPAVQPEEAKVRDHGYASSTPLADPDRLYVFFGKSGVLALTHQEVASALICYRSSALGPPHARHSRRWWSGWGVGRRNWGLGL